jgi:Protein of unknown function (DUF2794)
MACKARHPRASFALICRIGAEQGRGMNEGDIAKDRIGARPDSGSVIDFRPSPGPSAPPQVSFNRLELGAILNVYGRMVAAGEWRDYALDFNRDCAVFSIYRRASEMPLYRVVKTPALARRQGAYAVIVSAGHVLKRGQDLARVLAIFDKPVRLVT